MISIPGYEIKEKIYDGDYTQIYRGIRQSDYRAVILKVLNRENPTPIELSRLRGEYRITAKLNLSGCVQVYNIENYRNTLVIIYRDMGGESLISAVTSNRPELDRILRVFIKIADTVGHLHKSDVIHKDINPSNIVCNVNSGDVEVIDFGLSTDLSHEKQAITDPNVIEGTLAYISPEQTGRMNRVIDYRTDLYSMGVTFYHVLTSRLPFRTGDPMEMVHCHIARVPSSPHDLNPDIPVVLSRIIMKLMAKSAEDRYQSAFGVKHDLQRCLDQFMAKGRIEDFDIAQNDSSDRFELPQKLYGRENEIKTLMSVFDEVCTGSAEIVLVSGYSGVGKSSLVEEIHKPVVERRGYFIAGKFDHYRRDIPYDSLIRAFKELIRYILTESGKQVQNWKVKLNEALGNSSRVIAEVIPELSLILGALPPPAKLDGIEAQRRFNDAFEKFLSVFCTKEHPLVLFLDDLQWADQASLNLIRTVITGNQEHYLLIVGAYRDNEVSPSHPLILTLDEIEKKRSYTEITLRPLSKDDTKSFVVDTLLTPSDSTSSLSELIHAKTGGNPFFICQLLMTLYEERIIAFDFDAGQWIWDMKDIQSMSVSDNVVELLVNKIRKLPPDTQELLSLSSCLGGGFDLHTLASINNLSLKDTLLSLLSAVREGFVIPLDESYKYFEWSYEEDGYDSSVNAFFRFGHDRIQEAAYSRVSEERRKEIHLKIGQLLLEKSPDSEREEMIFELVDHFNQSIDLIDSNSELEEIASYNLRAAKKAKSSAAYDAALSYLMKGFELVSQDCWRRCHETMFEMHYERIECEFLCGNISKSEELFKITSQQSISKYEIAGIHQLMMRIYLNQYRYADGMKLGGECLRQFGIELPDDPEMLQKAIEEEFKVIGEKTAGIDIGELVNAPPMEERDATAMCGLLHEVWVCSFMLDNPKTPLIVLKIVTISLNHGQSALTAIGYVIYSVIISMQGDYDRAYSYGSLAMKLKDKYLSPPYAPKVNNTFCNFINHYKNHIETNIPIYEEAYMYCIESGEIWWGAFALTFIRLAKFIKGDNLSEVYKACQKYADYIEKAEFEPLVQIMGMETHVVQNLRGVTGTRRSLNSDSFNEEKMVELLNGMTFGTGLFWYYVHKSLLLLIYEEYDLALEMSGKAEEYKVYVPGIMIYPDHFFLNALIIAAKYESMSEEEKESGKELLERDLKQMEVWEKHCPENFRHRLLLMSAEKARINGDTLAAMDLYDKSIEGARENRFIHHEALANEMAARFYISRSKPKAAQGYMTEARRLYGHWGASAKVADLDSKYSFLICSKVEESKQSSTMATKVRVSTSGRETGKSLDLNSILKASLAIAGEIEMDDLLKKLMHMIIENAGAQKGLLIMEEDGELIIKASALVENESVILQSLSAEAEKDVLSRMPVSLINYTVRTREIIVLHNAAHIGLYTCDPYIKENKPLSVLCMPVIHQGVLSCILYLENSLISGAFTSDRCDVLQLISSEAAISIENAKLYRRIRESEKQYRQIFDNAIEGIFQVLPSGRLVNANRSMAAIVGYESPEVLIRDGENIWSKWITNSEDQARLKKIMEEKNQVMEFECQISLRDGNFSWASFFIQAIFDEKGQLLCHEGSVVDISERKKKEKAEREREVTEAINNKIMDSLRYAQMIQSSLLPNPDEVREMVPNCFIYWSPRDIVGGDLYFFETLDCGFMVAVIDCTGHGVPGAFMTMVASTIMRKILKDEGCADPAEILKLMNANVRQVLRQDTDYSTSDDGLDAAVCVITPEEKILTFAGAKLGLAYFGGTSLEFIKGDRQSIGYKRSDTTFNYTNHFIPYEEGMKFYMYTDGYIDQIGFEKENKFGSVRFRKLLSEIEKRPFEEQKRILIQTFNDHRGDNVIQDDVTVLGFSL